MQTYPCLCGNRLFFDSTRCVGCQAVTGMCVVCRQVVPLRKASADHWHCGNPACGALLKQCANYVEYQVCNRTVPQGEAELCDYCELNRVIPDLQVPLHLQRWRRLEAAKRRVLFGVETLGFSIATEGRAAGSPLRFEFKSDHQEPVMTGHADGCITINLREADDVEREKTRVAFGEPQRTLVGHFRHELGHFYWQQLVQPDRFEGFRQSFGDERQPAYAAAQQAYYDHGPQADWPTHFISAYASMHPWEDFAETFAAYLDMMAILETASHFAACRTQTLPARTVPLDDQINEYQRIGIMATEFNRDIGLLDLLPQVLVPPVIEKLRFIHGLAELV